MKRVAAVAFAGIGVRILMVMGLAGAGESSFSDPDDSPGLLDVIEISAGHDAPRTPIHTIRFQDDDPPVDATDIGLLLKYRVGGGEWRRATIAVVDNPDGSLYGEVLKRDSTPTSYTRAWRPSSDSIAIAFGADQLSPRADAYKWYVSTRYFNPDDDCAGHGCFDRAPDEGRILHRL